MVLCGNIKIINMKGIEDIDKIIKEVQEEITSFLYEPTPDDSEMIIQRGNQLQAYMGRLSKLLADVKYRQDMALVYNTRESKGEVVGTVMNSYVKAKCTDENYMVTLIDGLLRKCYAENEWNRTLVSKAKAEMQTYNQSKEYQ